MISQSSSSRGYALVITLAIVALIFAFAIFLLSSAGWERKSAASFRSAISTRQLADTAVGVVQGQINSASTQGGDVSWTSQPGMIRTFDPKGKLLKGYKLYSATDMVVGAIDLASDLPPGTWSSSPAIWTDLNAPVEISGVKYYPILDPSALGTSDAPQGLAINSAPGVSAASYQQAPMPVKWLYLLRNGELATATTNASSQVVVAAATTDNPVVGRIAFWTDDETTKVNINTASEGTYWDTPRVMTKQEQDLANYQPAQREFQRYPGHPATTSLSAVFPTLTAQQIFSITPKVIGGGSNAGTQVATGALLPDNDRLYADVGELIFDPKRNTNGGLSKTQVEQARFCLTAVSRAPEVNMFNLPRVAAWPIHEGIDQNHTTAFDRLIAFCSSIGDQPYYFQRSRADSTTHDISITRNADLFTYLQKLTSLDIPGYGGNFVTKYNADRNQILTEIFDYIRSTNLYDDNLATGNQFTKDRAANKMVGPAHGWVAPSVNTDGTLGLGRAFTLSEFGIAFICNAVADDPTTASDESSGSNIPTGAGANAVLGGTALDAGEKYIQAILIPEFFSAMQGYTVMWPQMSVRIKGLNTLSITRNGVTSSIFPAGMTEAVSINGTNPNALTSNRNFGGYCDWRYALVSPAATTPSTPYGSPARGNLPADTGDTYPFIGIPIKITAPATGGTMRFNGGDLTVEIYAVNSLTPTSTDLVQTIAIKLPAADFPIPSLVTGPLPAPSAGTADTSAKQSWWTFRKGGSVTGNVGRLSYAAQDPGQYQQLRTGQFLRKDGDVLRTVMPAHGDYRLVAGLQSVPDTVFIPHRYYSDTTKSLASNFIGGMGSHVFAGYDMDTKYLSNLYYGDSYAPDIPGNASLANRPESTGDYDTGISNYMDGPFINKPDEGDSNRGSSGTGIPYFSENWTQILLGATFFSPNRLIPSPGMFGSLPTGVKAGVPWRTLLFRPQPGHFGATSPKDSLLMDLFWMPVVEPYAISDRFSTAGKINMNYQILPFTYIERSTGLRALLKSERVMAIPDKEPTSGQSNVFTYKKYSATPPAYNYRMEIDPAETLSQFTKVFSTGDVFRSASDICDLYMVPKGQSLSAIDTFWAKNRLTGDNLREKVYTTLYPRLTTKSNAYTVHMKVQALRKKPGSSPTIWQEGIDEVLGEYRGATVIERFIDASNPDIPDYATASSEIGTNSLKTLDTFYKWRTISNRQFAP